MKYEITFNEEQVAYLSGALRYENSVVLPEEFIEAMRLFGGRTVSEEALRDFLITNGVFEIKRAVSRVVKGSYDVDTSSHYYYTGEEGWADDIGQDVTTQHKALSPTNGDFYFWSSLRRGRVRTFDQTLNLSKEQGVFPELLSAIIDEGKDGYSLNTNCRFGMVGWIVENDLHKDEAVIKQFLRGYFKGDEKVQIMAALIKDKELAKLELFWKSRAMAVKKMLIKRAPLKDLPFLLDTKNATLLKMIEEKMDAAIKADEAEGRLLKFAK
jgi:hypothetical protein